MDCLAQKLDSLLQSEAAMFEEARNEVEEIKAELAAMKSFLEDSEDPKATHSKSKQTHVAQVRDLVYDVEDIVDEFIHHRSKWQSSSLGTFSGYLRTALFFPLLFWERRQIAAKLKEITSLIKAIPERNQRYQQALDDDHRAARNTAVFNAESALFLKEEELVGIEPFQKLMVEWLTGGDNPRRKTISVVGMGGSGKTTLVANVFNSPAVKRCFDCAAWITVSQSFAIEDLLRSLIKEFGIRKMEQLSRMGYRELIEMLVEYLERKRYLVVLDDVWNANVWSHIKVWLPDEKNGSSVIVTTRIHDIAMYSSSSEDGNNVYNVKPLDKNKAMELFCIRAFSSKKCPLHLQSLAADIVEKCQGLPLAIVSLAGLLSTKRCSVADWTMVQKNLQWELSNNQILQPIGSILLLSYYDLPYRLRRCFLYCCLFPEDYKIWCGRLTRLWMAEGFVEDEQANGVTPEEVAKRYLMELIGRNLLQFVDSELSVNDRMCKMHDMYREVGLTIASQEKLFFICDVGNPAAVSNEDDAEHHHHRLSIHRASKIHKQDVLRLIDGMSRIRSLFIFPSNGCCHFSLSELDCTQLRKLRVLDFEEAPIEELPDHIDSLFNLRFLNLFATPVKRLPSSIARLQNLQTLDVVGTKIQALPKEVTELQKLRHLFTGYSKRTTARDCDGLHGIKLSAGSDIGTMKNLQSLRLVEASGHLVKQLRFMTQLVVLGITNLKGQAQMNDLCCSLKNMSLLQRLTIGTGNDVEILRLDRLGRSPPLPRLQYLSLFGKLEKFPRWICSLPSLVDLQMHRSCLPVEEDPLKHLHQLPSLSSIFLNNACQGTKLVFPVGFANLKTMALKNFPGLKSMTIADGAMPGIKILQVSSCMNLKTVPQGIQHLNELEQLRLDIVPAELVESICGPDRRYVQHIPLVRCHYYSSSGKYIRKNLF
ncbi:unnamed protein product [Linum tenue]|uniref:Uncharacterized protein n=1 Tax=Linum tenue TaxID=586396 RepID=A0AAV0IMD4_9ROSI|nr:unnamed protein product [Linum tenue]